ncbi:metaxin-1 isoform X2 [Rhizophagus clarus]|uniref:Metaxin-1 isoform X2 n=1 Tax=Rhizophagus clarus TaxID=94130 RepID=A0A8H3M8C5_9GLOM|nr:metaxin-1 isoform X2 [Rhizophagus clarus]
MFTLYVWGPGWDLPSIDPGCLTVIVYFQLLVSVEWGIIECNNPNISPTGELPVLKDGVEWIAGANNIIRHVKRKGFDADENLTTRQNADSVAYVSFVEDGIYDSLLYLWYADTKNFTQAISPLYGKLLAFPINYYIPNQIREIAKTRLEKYGVISVGDQGFLVDKELKMYKAIRKSYKILLDKIWDNEFFFGNKHGEFPRLVMFCDRMKGRLSEREIVKFPFNDLPSVFTGILKSPRTWFNNTFWQIRNVEKEAEKSQAQKDFERKRIISITGAILFMVTYVIWNKIISIEFISEKDKEYYDNDDVDDDDVNDNYDDSDNDGDDSDDDDGENE